MANRTILSSLILIFTKALISTLTISVVFIGVTYRDELMPYYSSCVENLKPVLSKTYETLSKAFTYTKHIIIDRIASSKQSMKDTIKETKKTIKDAKETIKDTIIDAKETIKDTITSAINKTHPIVITKEQLSRYNGEDDPKLYLAVLGSVFDVTKGKQHYGKGKTYNYFVGKDGSRAFVSGNFRDESDNKDHVIDLNCDELNSLFSWVKTFKHKYRHLGVVIGRYFNEKGKPTHYSKQLDLRMQECKKKENLEKLQDEQYPPCNMEWTAHEGSKVWCSKNSGGVSRSWAGVPRLLYTPGDRSSRCVCVNLDNVSTGVLLKEYQDCKPQAKSCKVHNSP